MRATAALGDAQVTHAQLLHADIERFLTRPFSPAKPMAVPTVPPGAPIGGASAAFLSRDEVWCGVSSPSRQTFFEPLVGRRPER
jgi:hypothetical protein